MGLIQIKGKTRWFSNWPDGVGIKTAQKGENRSRINLVEAGISQAFGGFSGVLSRSGINPCGAGVDRRLHLVTDYQADY